MRRFHVHISVENLEESKTFYSQVFGPPTVVKHDYAKWMLEDPPVNLAISMRGRAPGVDHLGVQVDCADDLALLGERLASADSQMLAEDGANCCYAKSDKYWVTDPNGIAWETFHTLADIPMFGTDRRDAVADPLSSSGSTCCAPKVNVQTAIGAPPEVTPGCAAGVAPAVACCGRANSSTAT